MQPQPTATGQSPAGANNMVLTVPSLRTDDVSGITDPGYIGKSSRRKKGYFKFARFPKKLKFSNSKKDKTVLSSEKSLSTETTNRPSHQIIPADKLSEESTTNPPNLPSSNVIRESDYPISQDGIESSLEHSVESLSTDCVALFNSGQVSLREGDLENARYQLSKSLRANTAENGLSHESVSLANEKLGDICVTCKEYQLVYRHYEAALEIMRTNKTKNRRFVDILLKMAGAMLENGENDLALDCCTEALPVLKNLEEEGNEENREQEDITEVLIKIGNLHYDAGHYDDALIFFKSALSSKFANTKHDLSSVCLTIGLIYEKKNDYDMAIEYCTLSLSMKKTAVGEYHSDVANVLRKIGNVLFKKGQYESALDFYDQALVVLKYNEVDFEAAMSVHDDIVDTHRKTGDMSNAINRYRDLLEATKLSLGDKSDEVGTVLYRLACIHVEIGENDVAIPILRETEKIKKENKNDLMQTAMILIKIGSLYLAGSAAEKALLYFEDAIHQLSLVLKNDRDYDLCDGDLVDKLIQCEEALKTDRNVSTSIPSPSFAEVADVLNDMGNLYSSENSYYRALCCYESCLRIKMDIDSPDCEEMFKIQNNIGLVHFKLGSFDEAMVVYEKVLSAQKCANNNNCVETAMTLFHIGNVQFEKGSFKEAIRFYKESVEIRRVKLGSDHRDTLAAIFQIGKGWLRMGEYKKSIMAFAEVLHMLKGKKAENYEDIASTKCMIGVAHAQEQNLDTAMEFFGESLRLRTDVLGRNHVKVGKTLAHMAAVLYVQKDYKATKIICEDALAIFKHEKLSEDHPYMRELKHMMRKLDKKLSRLPGKQILEKSMR